MSKKEAFDNKGRIMHINMWPAHGRLMSMIQSNRSEVGSDSKAVFGHDDNMFLWSCIPEEDGTPLHWRNTGFKYTGDIQEDFIRLEVSGQNSVLQQVLSDKNLPSIN